MANEIGLKIGIYILAVALVGAAVTQAAFANGTAFRPHHVSRSGQSGAKHISEPTSGHPDVRGEPKADIRAPAEIGAEPKAQGSKAQGSKAQDVKEQNKVITPNNTGLSERGGKRVNGNVAGPNGEGIKVPIGGQSVGRDVNAPETRSRDVNAIDTSVTVQFRRPINRQDKPTPKRVITSVAPRNLLGRHAPFARATDRVTRNAIGATVVRQEGVQAGDEKPHGSRSAAPISAALAGRTEADTGLDHRAMLQPNASPSVKPVALSHGMIDGTSVTHPGFAPSGIGGPAKLVAGINGTTMRLKH